MNSLVSATSTEAIKDFSSSQEIVATSSEVTAIVVDEFCITTEIRLKVGSSVNMLGQVVDHYEVYVSVTCYFPTPPCSLC